LVAALGVPGLAPRLSLLEPGLDGIPPPTPPAWLGSRLADRLPALKANAQRMSGGNGPAVIRVLLPSGSGGDLVFDELARDWGALGFTVERGPGPAIATFAMIDEIAPSSSPAWFVRRFRCGVVPVCDSDADQLMDSARAAPVPAQRYALLGQAASRIDDAALFIPLTSPVRW